jgi:hypothetical protein
VLLLDCDVQLCCCWCVSLLYIVAAGPVLCCAAAEPVRLQVYVAAALCCAMLLPARVCLLATLC